MHLAEIEEKKKLDKIETESEEEERSSIMSGDNASKYHYGSPLYSPNSIRQNNEQFASYNLGHRYTKKRDT